MSRMTRTDHIDVLIVGAGVSGIGAGYHLQDKQPGRTYAILEARDAIGGTWDLFRYPGIRSDSDLYTFGYAFKPWTGEQSLADGPSIKAYVEETAREHGIDRHIRFRHNVLRAEFDSVRALWTVAVAHDSSTFEMTARWLFCAGGYYDYAQGYTPHFEGLERFGGDVVHPQQWPEDLDCTGKRIVVIGSGATAVTLVPALAGTAGHVTMLQRSPTYVLPVPERDPIANALRRRLPADLAHRIIRRKNILIQQVFFGLSRRYPEVVRRLIRWVNARELEGSGVDVDVHFKPRYDPWTQRLCAVPQGDLYRALHRGDASIVTDRIATFTETGIQLVSGAHLEADIVVTATGLNIQAMGGLELVVDGEEVVLSDTVAYKGMMLGGVPNMVFAVGYTNASWTLKVDLVCEHFCRLLAHLDRQGHDAFVAEVQDPDMPLEPLLDFQAGYVLRALDRLPKQGNRAPWNLKMNYFKDARHLRRGTVADDGLRCFSAVSEPVEPPLAVAG